MTTATIALLRDLVRAKNYVVSHHAADEREAETVVKVGFTGALIFITAYAI